MDIAEYHVAKAQSYAQNFHSLRQVEWQVAFQACAGYAAIAIGFHSLLPTGANPPPPDLSYVVVAIGATFFIFVVTLYTSLRILERLHQTRDLENKHLDAARSAILLLAKDDIPGPKNTAKWPFWFKPHSPPIHGRWYAFFAQLSINIAWFVGVLGYVIQQYGACRLFGVLLSHLINKT